MLNEDSLTRDITQLAEDGDIEPTYGRVKEIFAVFEILARTKSRNVVLVGHDGVGKRRIAEGIALAGVQGESQGLLDDFRLLELDLAVLATGAADGASALRTLLKHLRLNRDILLFIDDVHLVMQAESTELGEADFPLILKPALARGDIVCIGATTPDKFRQFMQTDPAIRKQFEVIHVEPMSEAATFDVLTKLQPTIESHHNLKISEKALRAAVLLTEQYLTDQYLPGKAIEVVDQACARYRYKSVAGKNHPGLIEDASLFMLKEEVTPHDVRKVVQNMASVSMQQLTLQDSWSDIENRIKTNIFGQDFAVSKTISRLRQAHEALSDTHRPEAILLFLGPHGVGKQCLAELLAEVIFGSSDNMLSFDMAVFDEGDFCAALLGEEITESDIDDSAKTPYFPNKVLFFKNIEDADSKTFEYLVPILEEGRVETRHGREIVLKNAVVVFAAISDEKTLDIEEIQSNFDQWIVGLRQIFRPTFFNQIDEVVPFFPLEYKHLQAIMRHQINGLRSELEERRVHVGMHRAAYRLLAKKGYSKDSGVGALKTYVEDVVIEPIRDMVNTQRLSGDAEIHVLIRDGNIVFGGSLPKLLEDRTTG